MKKISFFIIILLVFSCKTTQNNPIVFEEYFEVFENKRIAQGHYGGYFILDGNKRVYRIHFSDKSELIAETSQSDNLTYSGTDFHQNLVVISSKENVYRVIKGNLIIKDKKDAVELDANIWGIKNMWELVSDTIPEIDDEEHLHLIKKQSLKLKPIAQD